MTAMSSRPFCLQNETISSKKKKNKKPSPSTLPSSHSQQIITQDFARNQVSSQSPTSTFQTSPSALASTPVRTKPSSRYSPESQSQTVLHPRPGSRVSPENLVDKSRGR